MTNHPPPRKRIKGHDLITCTWNVRSLNKLGAISQLETVLEAYKTEIIALQEMRNEMVRDKQISVPVISATVAMFLGTNSGVALQ